MNVQRVFCLHSPTLRQEGLLVVKNTSLKVVSSSPICDSGMLVLNTSVLQLIFLYNIRKWISTLGRRLLVE